MTQSDADLPHSLTGPRQHCASLYTTKRLPEVCQASIPHGNIFFTHKDKEKKNTNMPGRLYSYLSCCFFSLPSSSHESHHGPTLPPCFQLGPGLSNVLSLLPGLISHNSKPSRLILSLQVPLRAGACLNCSDNSHQELP